MKLRNAERGGRGAAQSLEAVDPSERGVSERLARREKSSASSGARVDDARASNIDHTDTHVPRDSSSATRSVSRSRSSHRPTHRSRRLGRSEIVASRSTAALRGRAYGRASRSKAEEPLARASRRHRQVHRTAWDEAARRTRRRRRRGREGRDPSVRQWTSTQAWSEIASRNGTRAVKPSSGLLTTKAAAEYCGFRTVHGLHSAHRDGKIFPVGRRGGGGGTMMWSIDDLDAFLRGGTDRSRDERPEDQATGASQGGAALREGLSKVARKEAAAASLLRLRDLARYGVKNGTETK